MFTGGFRNFSKILTNWNIVKSPSSITNEFNGNIKSFDYSNCQGIWPLRSTSKYYKKPSLGLSSSLLTISGENTSWSLRSINIGFFF